VDAVPASAVGTPSEVVTNDQKSGDGDRVIVASGGRQELAGVDVYP
jgi:hypothetical protein